MPTCLELIFTLGLVSLAITGPDTFIKPLIKWLLHERHEDTNPWSTLSRILGWIERALFALFFVYLPSEFIVFVGIWFAFKAIGSFNSFQPPERAQPEWHERIHTKRRAEFMAFVIGSGISLLWVIFVVLFSYNVVQIFLPEIGHLLPSLNAPSI